MNREQRRSQLSGKGAAPAKEFSLSADIMYNKADGKITIVYSRTINNVSYTPDQLRTHINGLIGAAKMLDSDWKLEP